MGHPLEKNHKNIRDDEMEALWDKFGAILGAIITALGGVYVYDRTTIHNRLTKVENDLVQSRMDIKIIETKFIELKEDTVEIKDSQKEIIDLLTKRRYEQRTKRAQ